MNAKLIVRRENGQTAEFLLQKDETKVGRSSVRNDLFVDDPLVSREHAVFRRDGRAFTLIDLGSANGTTINGQALDGAIGLHKGDVVGLGKTTLTFVPDEPEPEPERPPSSDDIRFDEVIDTSGTVMFSIVPEALLRDLELKRERRSGEMPAIAQVTSPKAERDELAKLRKKSDILALLYELGRTLSSVFSLEEVYKKASDIVFKVTPADHCLILLQDRKTGELKPVSVELREIEGATSPVGMRGNIVISRTITDRVLQEGIALLVYDAQKDFGSESIILQAIHSVMCSPLIGKDGLLGAIYVDRRDLIGRFEEDDLDLLSAIASQTAIAIESTKFREQLQREAIVRERLGRFLPTGVVDRVMKGEIKLGGVSQEVTTLFCDIRGFTPMSERTTPEMVVQVLNEHFSLMTEAIVKYGGTLDKYIGDSVMALFGAPYSNPDDDPIHAVSAAIQMQKSMALVNQKLSERGLPNVQIGIGINTGFAIVGEIGSEKQMNYTAIGDSVNLAARLEANAKPGQILVSSTTASKLRSYFPLYELAPIRVKGKQDAVPVHEVVWKDE